MCEINLVAVSQFNNHSLYRRKVIFKTYKNINNELRSTMSQKKLSLLSILCIENETFIKINFDELIEDLYVKKMESRRDSSGIAYRLFSTKSGLAMHT